MLVVGVNPVEVKRFSNPKLVTKPLEGVSMVIPSTDVVLAAMSGWEIVKVRGLLGLSPPMEDLGAAAEDKFGSMT